MDMQDITRVLALAVDIEMDSHRGRDTTKCNVFWTATESAGLVYRYSINMVYSCYIPVDSQQAG